jgi:hypothetical protein
VPARNIVCRARRSSAIHACDILKRDAVRPVEDFGNGEAFLFDVPAELRQPFRRLPARWTIA